MLARAYRNPEGRGEQGIGLCLINSIDNNFSSLWLTTNQPNTGLLYSDSLSIAENSFSSSISTSTIPAGHHDQYGIDRG